MYPEDRILVGVIKAKRDLEIARNEHWYRIPQRSIPRGINAEYVAFFLSGSNFRDLLSGVHFYAPIQGVELTYRRWLLPKQPHHKRADEPYYKITIGDLQAKAPPITNDTRRAISFIYTTWDRFTHAGTIKDLYSRADYFVDRIYHALRSEGVRSQRFWEAESKTTGYPAGLEVLCERGPIYLSTTPTEDALYMDWTLSQNLILARIRAEIARQGGLADISAPLDFE